MNTLFKILFVFMFVFYGCYDQSDIKVPGFPVGFFDFIDTGVVVRSGMSPSIMIFGDSRMYGGGTFDGLPNTVFNVAYPGTTTSGVFYRLHYFDEYRPDIVIIGIGVNNSLIGTPPEEYIESIHSIIEYFDGSSKVIVFSIPQTSVEKKLIGEYNSLLSELPEYVQLDFTQDMMNADGIHFNQKGYDYITERIKEKYI